jgi:hypothetical protein
MQKLAVRRTFRYIAGIVDPASQESLKAKIPATADVLFVRVPLGVIGSLQSDLFNHAESGGEALGMLKLLRFRLLVASLDVPDMPVWVLFQKARQAQARLQCVLLDARFTPENELRIRQAGASAFMAMSPAFCAALFPSEADIA